MDEDMKDRFEDEDEGGSNTEPAQPFFQTVIGRIIMVVGLYVVIVLTALFVSNIVYAIRDGEREKELERKRKAEYAGDMEDQPVLIKNSKNFVIEQMNLNLDDPGAYLSVEVSLAYDAGQENLEFEMGRRRDQITSIVRHILEANTRKDIDTVDERNGILKPKIKNRINEILKNGEIYNVYFPAFTMQYSPVN